MKWRFAIGVVVVGIGLSLVLLRKDRGETGVSDRGDVTSGVRRVFRGGFRMAEPVRVNSTNTAPLADDAEYDGVVETNTALAARSSDIIPGEYVLSFYSEGDRDAFLRVARLSDAEILGLLGIGNSVRLKVKDRAALDAILEKSPVATDLSRNVYVRLPEREETRPLMPEGTYAAFGGEALEWLGLSGDNSAWGQGVTIAVLDTGLANPSTLFGAGTPQIDLVQEATDTEKTATGHGLAVAALLVGAGENVRGVVPSADILSIKVLSGEGVGDSFTLAQGIVEAVNAGAGVINLSLGSSGDCHILREAVAYATERDVLIVAAAGNDATRGVAYPARYDDVLAVGGIDASGRHMYFSNRGEEVDIAAPGHGVHTMWEGDATVGFSGTSAATPFASGVAAGLLSENPDFTPREIAAILRRHADEAGEPGEDDRYGAGILNIRRILDRNTTGIYDIAVARPHVLRERTATGDVVVQVYAQNRGTEPLDVVDLEINLGSGSQSFSFYNVDVGAVVSREIYVSAHESGDEDGLSLRVSADTPRNSDTYPMNNTVSGAVFARGRGE